MLLDKNYRPYVLEANLLPAISALELRRQLIFDCISLLDPPGLDDLIRDWSADGNGLLQVEEWGQCLARGALQPKLGLRWQRLTAAPPASSQDI